MERKNPLRVFLVEDSQAVMNALKALISEIEGVEIAGCVRDAGSAEDALPRVKPDVIVLDIRMPNGSGLKILKRIREERRTTPLIIVFSGEADQIYRRVCLKLGADFFFDKSSEFDRVPDVLRSLVANPGA